MSIWIEGSDCPAAGIWSPTRSHDCRAQKSNHVVSFLHTDAGMFYSGDELIKVWVTLWPSFIKATVGMWRLSWRKKNKKKSTLIAAKLDASAAGSDQTEVKRLPANGSNPIWGFPGIYIQFFSYFGFSELLTSFDSM